MDPPALNHVSILLSMPFQFADFMIIVQDGLGIFSYGGKKLDFNGLTLFLNWMVIVKRIT